MRAPVTRLRDDRTREKLLVADWPDPGTPSDNQVWTRTVCSGITFLFRRPSESTTRS